jgi:RND family efflux transporter MFP subunit
MFISAALALALTATSAGCHRKQPAAPEPPEVYVSHPLEREYTEFTHYTGRTAAIETQEVKARVAGPVVSVNFQDGAEVKAGQVLYEIDPRTFQADYNAAVSKVRSAEAQLAASTDDSRRKETSFTGTSEGDKFAARAKMESDQAALDTARADAELKRLNLDFTKVRAEIGGITSRTQITRGTIVQAGQTGGTLLTTIVSVDPVYAYFDVDERTILRVRQMIRDKKFVTAEMRRLDPFYSAASTMGQLIGCAAAPLNSGSALYPGRTFAVVPIRLELENETEFPHKGYIDFVDNQVNPSTGTLRLRGLFWSHDRVLTPGLFVRVQVPIGQPQKALMVPDRAVVTDQAQKVLYVLNDRDEVVYRPVVLGGLQDGLRVIAEGLTRTDRVIVDGIQRVRPGVTVKPQPANK